MDPKHLTAVLVSAILGVILLVTVVAPIVSDGQTTIGDPVTYTNPLNDGNYYMRQIEDGDTLVCTVTEGQSTTVYVNGEQIRTIDGSILGGYHDLIMTNVYTCNTGGSTSGLQIASVNSTTVGYTSTVTISYNNGEITQASEGQTPAVFSGVTWGYIVCNEPDAGYYESVRTGGTPFYVKDNNDVVCAGVYTTGDNDTYYWYKDGVTEVAQDYTSGSAITKTLVAGTTDIYQATITITVGDEEFTPYRVLIPIEVTGHATSGSLYSMLGVIPIVVAIGIVLGVVSMAIVNRYD